MFRLFEFWSFGFVSSFPPEADQPLADEIRISNFPPVRRRLRGRGVSAGDTKAEVRIQEAGGGLKAKGVRDDLTVFRG